MTAAVAMKGKGYDTSWSRVITAITEAQAEGTLSAETERYWIQTRCGDKLPPFDEEILIVICDWFLENTRLCQLTSVKSSVNYNFQRLGQPKPWTGHGRIMRKYEHEQFIDLCARADADIAAGKTPKLQRMELPEKAVWRLIDIGEDASISSKLLGKVALMDIGILAGLRAASLKLESQESAQMLADGWLQITIQRVKGRELIDEVIDIPPGPPDAPEHPRNRMFATIKKAIDEKCLYIPKGSVTAASNKITKVLQEQLFGDELKLPKGKCLSSHSLRKTMASMAASLGLPTKVAAMSWGGWGSEDAMRPYINRHYKGTGLAAQLFDWLTPSYKGMKRLE